MTLTSKQEAFARFFVETGNASEAYRRAYQVSEGIKPETVHKRASELLANGEVTGRVSQLQGKAAKRAEITVQSLADELEEARAIALAEKQSSAAVSATMGKAKLFGLGVENRRMSGTIQIVNITIEHLSVLTRDELTLLEAAYPVLEKLRLVGSDTSGEGEA
jgi:phage terminase small subunit